MRIVKISEKGEAIKKFDVKPVLEKEPDSLKMTHTKNINDIFYEIDYEANPIPGVGILRQKAEPIQDSQGAEVVLIFNEMRRIRPLPVSKPSIPRKINIYSNYYFESSINSKQFYDQAKFMVDFSDDFDGTPSLFRYFPVYQGMSDNQLRRYFSWRTAVRQGTIKPIDPSYAFIYVYELLNNIGVSDAEDGLNKLINFWKAFKKYTESLNRYILRWIKDYCIFYDLPTTFRNILKEHELTEEYPVETKVVTEYSLFMNLSSYNITKSKFYSEKTTELIEGCFCRVIDNLRTLFSESNRILFNAIYEIESKYEWEPFREAVFHKYHLQIQEKVVEYSFTQTYTCKKNEWVVTERYPSDSSKKFITYVVKKLECELRRITKYKNSITAVLSELTTPFLVRNRIDKNTIDSLITKSINEYYREKNRVVVSVDDLSLSRIRDEAYETQEKLTVEEEKENIFNLPLIETIKKPTQQVKERNIKDSNFSDTEKEVFRLLLTSDSDIKEFASRVGIMLEVLVDGINEKAVDFFGDSLIDEEYVIYDEYLDLVKGIVS